MPSATTKHRTNVTLDAHLVEEARAFGLNVSAISQAALAQAVREAKAKAWREENAEALARHAARVEREGPLLARW